MSEEPEVYAPREWTFAEVFRFFGHLLRGLLGALVVVLLTSPLSPGRSNAARAVYYAVRSVGGVCAFACLAGALVRFRVPDEVQLTEYIRGYDLLSPYSRGGKVIAWWLGGDIIVGLCWMWAGLRRR